MCVSVRIDYYTHFLPSLTQPKRSTNELQRYIINVLKITERLHFENEPSLYENA